MTTSKLNFLFPFFGTGFSGTNSFGRALLREILKIDPDEDIFSYFGLLLLSFQIVTLLQWLTINIRYQLPIIFRSLWLEKIWVRDEETGESSENGSADLWVLQHVLLTSASYTLEDDVSSHH